MDKNKTMEDWRQASSIIARYLRHHPIRTRHWNCIVTGGVQELKDTPWERWIDIPGVIVGVDPGREVELYVRDDLYAKLGAAGLDHVPIHFIETERYKIGFYMDKPSPSAFPDTEEQANLV